MLICADVNAHSTLWFNRRNDDRGRLVEQFILDKGLTYLNVDQRIPTFHGPRDQSFIDITLASGNLSASCLNWRVVPGVTSSDHAGVLFDLVASGSTAFLTREF